MNINQYLDRIQYQGPLNPSLEVLTNLQQAHLLHVPFENLDIHYHRKIDLSNSFSKIVIHRRGGFCYELNGLFYTLLKEFGFTARMVSARVFEVEKGYGPEFDHMAIIVKIDQEEFLTDVGFGEFAFTPLRIELNTNQEDPRGVFRIEQFDEQHYLVLKKDKSGEFKPEYLFSGVGRHLEEFYEMCLFHQTSETSHFTKKLLCTLPIPNGRITLTGNVLKFKSGDHVTEGLLEDEEAIKAALSRYFGIHL